VTASGRSRRKWILWTAGTLYERRPPRACLTEKPGTYFLAATPNQFVYAVLGRCVAREAELEFVGEFKVSIEIDPHTATGNVGHEAVARGGVIPGQNGRQTYHAVTGYLASVVRFRQE
jgi:hypothetical protein